MLFAFHKKITICLLFCVLQLVLFSWIYLFLHQLPYFIESNNPLPSLNFINKPLYPTKYTSISVKDIFHETSITVYLTYIISSTNPILFFMADLNFVWKIWNDQSRNLIQNIHHFLTHRTLQFNSSSNSTTLVISNITDTIFYCVLHKHML